MQFLQLNQNIWFYLFFVNFFLLGFVGVFAYYVYYRRLVEQKKSELDTYKNSEKILEDAKKRSLEVIEKIEQKANEILTHSQLFKTDLDKAFKGSLDEMANKYLEMIQEHSKKFNQDYENILTSVKNESLIRSKQAMDNIENQIVKHLDDSKGELKEEMRKSLQKSLEEINQYKIKEMAKVDEEIDRLVVEMVKDLLRINLTPKDHRKLVIQSLEKAKEQGMFFL